MLAVLLLAVAMPVLQTGWQIAWRASVAPIAGDNTTNLAIGLMLMAASGFLSWRTAQPR